MLECYRTIKKKRFDNYVAIQYVNSINRAIPMNQIFKFLKAFKLNDLNWSINRLFYLLNLI